jgi:hypothetical protein
MKVKQTLFVCIAMMVAGTVNVSAQLKVNSDGKVIIASADAGGLDGSLYVKKASPSSNYYYKAALGGNYYASSSAEGITMGVFGKSNTVGGLGNYGVGGFGWDGTHNTGIYGTDTGVLVSINGGYAGYFYGPTYVYGTLTATSVMQTSDIRLKNNVSSLSSSTPKGTTLQNVMDMDVITYNLNLPRQYDEEELKKHSEDLPENTLEKLKQREEAMSAQKHFGLSAQDLQKIYPDLVVEGQDGYLAVNYTELVPILIRSIQELKAELEEVKGCTGEQARSDAAAIRTAAANGNVLYQNTPNPFKEKTVIRFALAVDAQNAAICIFDMSGKMLKKLPVQQGDTAVSVNGYELGEGMFLYTLLVNGQEMDTKRMIITK